LDEISPLAKLVKSLLDETRVLPESEPYEEPPLSPSAQRISLVKALQEIVLTMKDAFFEVERSLIDIMGNDLVKPLTPGRAIELVRMEAKQLDLLFIAAKNYIKVRNKFDKRLNGGKQPELVGSTRDEVAEAFRAIQDQVRQTEETLNKVYEEMAKQRELADLLEKKQFL